VKTVAVLSLTIASWLISAWTLMLTVGIVHAEWIPQLPTIGFRLALLLAGIFFIRAVIAAVFTEVLKADRR
jgi:hypothetical protein